MLQPRIPRLLTSHLLNTSLPPPFLLPSRLAPRTLLQPPPSSQQQTRPASHASQGRANKAAQGPGKRLGAKKGDSEFVVPGNIIFRQRGTHWFAGENCGMGRDHTIFALEKGYVRYYKDENWGVRRGHGKKRNRKEGGRKFIGVVLERGMTLPRAQGTARVRRVGLESAPARMSTGMTASTPRTQPTTDEATELNITIARDAPVAGLEGKGERRLAKLPVVKGNAVNPMNMPLKPGYMYRKSNWEIGRAAERAKETVREYRRGDRWLAWRKRVARRTANRERRVVGRVKKGKRAG